MKKKKKQSTLKANELHLSSQSSVRLVGISGLKQMNTDGGIKRSNDT
jgi:hypothetical protein